jgi:hypothetical protein
LRLRDRRQSLCKLDQLGRRPVRRRTGCRELFLVCRPFAGKLGHRAISMFPLGNKLAVEQLDPTVASLDIAPQLGPPVPSRFKDMWADHAHGLLTDNEMETLDEAGRGNHGPLLPAHHGSPHEAPGVPSGAERSCSAIRIVLTLMVVL